MTDFQVYGGDDKITSIKSDAGYVFYHILLFIGDLILLGGFKLGDKSLDMSVVDTKSFGSGEGADFILN